MKNNSNIYDIDGEIIRTINDTHRWTIEEAQKKIEYYREKLKNLDEKDPKYSVYSTYIRNLSSYIMNEYSKLTPDKIKNIIQQKSTEEQIKDAINDLKNDIETEANTENEILGTSTENNKDNTDKELGNDETIEREFGNIHEERPVSQSDLLVERDGVNTNMDEYVQFEEI